jgi:hypothetical protein
MSAFATAVIEVPDLSRLSALSHLELQEALGRAGEARNRVDVVIAALAGEVDRRSARELGHSGLAQSTGDRTPDALVSRLTGMSGPEARNLVTVGVMASSPQPWLADVATAFDDGSLSVGAAAAIKQGLGVPSESVAADDLLDAAQKLLASAGNLPPEKVAQRARELRDELDSAGIAAREADLRDRRFLRLTRQADGMTKLFGLLDPESAALITDAFDCVTAPRRGGPRFVDSAELARVEALEKDPRTIEQITVDAFVEMVRIAGDIKPNTVFGVRRPSVRVHVDARDLERREGAGRLEGQTLAVSMATVERLACAEGYVPVIFQPDGTLDVGQAQRLFTTRQRIALDAIWGGCAYPGCERPPSWCEAHHAIPWKKGGPTDVANGTLLCRFHHMMVHNNGWTIRPPGTAENRWLLLPPPGDPLNRHPIVLESKHPEHLRTGTRRNQ